MPWPQATGREDFMKFSRVVLEICARTEIQTDTLIPILGSTDYNNAPVIRPSVDLSVPSPKVNNSAFQATVTTTEHQ